ncbi:hypothetical protein ppKF707_4896 [Metapseudomonas furukawaii]|uniref:Uncharacterized protein n=1 Tax=Metapseudomonas furukawaii TaxID=1149133 RepID=A0AAD1C220_METFU|nr:hypothetical protein ppKF707_4896 [Pseudomonas furukawaii]BAU75332.1 hypothetical protein KF707C_36440 [Pseudomonas furukawaii]
MRFSPALAPGFFMAADKAHRAATFFQTKKSPQCGRALKDSSESRVTSVRN